MKINRFAKRVSAVIAGLALSIVLAPACAEKIDFDQGVDASQILSDIRQQIPLALIDKASLIPVLSVTKEPDFTILGAVIGMDLRTRLAQSGPYKTAAKYPPLIETLPPDVRDPLKAEWASISTIWNGLFTEATGLEAEDDRLYARAEALDRNAERLKRNGEKLEVEIGNFNRQCTGRPLPPDEYKACIRWQDDLKKRIGAHNAEVEKHNNAAIQWRSDVTDLRRRAGTEQAAAKQKISPWLPRVTGVEGQRLIPFSDAAQKALDEHRGCGRLIGLKIAPASVQYLPTGSRATFSAIPEFGHPADKPCPVTYLWTTENSVGNIGRLEVQTGEKNVNLMTGSDEAKGFVKIEVDEAIGKKAFKAQTQVTVARGALQCKVVGLQCVAAPEGRWRNVCTYDCCGRTEIDDTTIAPICVISACPTKFCVP